MIKKYYLIFISLCVLFSIENTNANKADSLFRLNEFKAASLEYERIIAYSSAPIEISEARYKKALCYKFLQTYDKAQLQLLKINYWNLADSLIIKYRYETVLCSYLAGSFPETLSQINQLEQSDLPQVKHATALLIKTLCFNELQQWKEAHEAALSYISYTCPKQTADSIALALNNLYAKKNLPKIKSEKKSKVLKMLPGLGQAYAGEFWEGALNFSLNLAFLSFGAYQIYQGFYITGYFVGTIGLNKVYFGGHARTTYLIHRNNYRKHKAFCEKAKKILIEKKAGF